MAFIRSCAGIVMVLQLSTSVWSMSLEPKYTKYMFQEQLLEKMVRFEQFVENLENEMRQLMADSKASVQEIQTSTKNELEKVTERVDEFQQNISKLREDMSKVKGLDAVVFNAYSDGAQTRKSSEPVIFKHVIVNEGNHYDNSTGVFTAPVKGVYQFNAQLCVNKGLDLEYAIFADTQYIMKGEYRSASDGDDEKCAAFSTVGIVSAGGKVSVRGYGVELDATGDDRHSFSGVLIHTM